MKLDRKIATMMPMHHPTFVLPSKKMCDILTRCENRNWSERNLRRRALHVNYTYLYLRHWFGTRVTIAVAKSAASATTPLLPPLLLLLKTACSPHDCSCSPFRPRECHPRRRMDVVPLFPGLHREAARSHTTLRRTSS